MLEWWQRPLKESANTRGISAHKVILTFKASTWGFPRSNISFLFLSGMDDVSRIGSASSSSQPYVPGGEALWMACCKMFNIEGRSGVNDVAARRALVKVSDHDWYSHLFPFIEDAWQQAWAALLEGSPWAATVGESEVKGYWFAENCVDVIEEFLASRSLPAANMRSIPNPRMNAKRKRPETYDDSLDFVFNGDVEDVVEEPRSEASQSDSVSSGDNSDDEDSFQIMCPTFEDLSEDYKDCFLFRWHEATQDLCKEMREDVRLPLDPRVQGEPQVYDTLASGILLPSWHCAFAGCKAGERHVSKANHHEKSLWNHVWSAMGHQERLVALIRKYGLVDDTQHEEEVAFTCYNAAIAERERLTVPQLGLCTDRRCLRHIGETFYETNMEVLMCFVCGGKHLSHSGYDKFGNPKDKGHLSIRTGSENWKRFSSVARHQQTKPLGSII